MNLEEKIQDDFKLKEFLHSNLAEEMGVDLSNPPEEVVENIKKVSAKAQQVRNIFKARTHITSCWRPDALNSAIPGRPAGKKGAHPEALAIDVVVDGFSVRDVFNGLIKDPTFMEDVDQLIIERGCVHIGLPCASTNYGPARRELRKEEFVDGARKYPSIGVWTPNGITNA